MSSGAASSTALKADHNLSGYALWIVPSESQTPSYQSLISHLASLEPSSPSFNPHITLLHPIPLSTPLDEIHSTLRQAIDRASTKSGSMTDKPLTLGKAQSGEKYYQSVLAPVEPTPSLLALREEVQSAFRLTGLKEYFPHLSLLYGDLTKERRDELALIANEKGFEKEVEVKEVVIVRSVGSAEEWKTVGREKL
ncbi:hypothetical protein CI109_101284 [Kwoniella shandongensis]|uniref:Uncharacterized protein n=1 Tax=Kwoniella shandongensis TaxID=1734106 RepID=A0A5M6BU60_9TREE|nr:uncharacterized protein CI109_005341 [Kwoniella shandongensis]KAA5526384.1 hypothetical protein CI109_005341 [Kwoniella shandongensis]